MTRPTCTARVANLAVLLATATALSACGDTFTRLSRLGSEPPMTPMQNPAERQAPVTMPMPAPVAQVRAPNSLWRAGARAFLKDQRASQVGDIVTVVFNPTDTASFSNTSTRSRQNTETANTTNLLGYETNIWNKLPGRQDTVDPTSLLSLGSTLNNTGTGTIERSDSLSVRVAAVVTQVLPNGNLVLQGTQEVRVNFETRVLQVGGVIRPADILSTNEVTYDKMAEARFSYGGRGQQTDMQQPRWGSQVIDVLMPF